MRGSKTPTNTVVALKAEKEEVVKKVDKEAAAKDVDEVQEIDEVEDAAGLINMRLPMYWKKLKIWTKPTKVAKLRYKQAMGLIILWPIRRPFTHC